MVQMGSDWGSEEFRPTTNGNPNSLDVGSSQDPPGEGIQPGPDLLLELFREPCTHVTMHC